jgi:hypothetical protein
MRRASAPRSPRCLKSTIIRFSPPAAAAGILASSGVGPALSWEVALAETYACAGSQFDPHVVAAFGEVLPRFEALYQSFRSEGFVARRTPI